MTGNEIVVYWGIGTVIFMIGAWCHNFFVSEERDFISFWTAVGAGVFWFIAIPVTLAVGIFMALEGLWNLPFHIKRRKMEEDQKNEMLDDFVNGKFKKEAEQELNSVLQENN